jgi:hypothetical protein
MYIFLLNVIKVERRKNLFYFKIFLWNISTENNWTERYWSIIIFLQENNDEKIKASYHEILTYIIYYKYFEIKEKNYWLLALKMTHKIMIKLFEIVNELN